MDNLLKVFMGTFFLILITTTGMLLISSSIYARQADKALSNYERAIENANSSEAVVTSCVKDAADHKFKLTFDTEKQDYTGRVYNSQMYLTYSFFIPFVGSHEKTISATID